jgi:hypothetical protein
VIQLRLCEKDAEDPSLEIVVWKLCTMRANAAKGNMTFDEFVSFCGIVAGKRGGGLA